MSFRDELRSFVRASEIIRQDNIHEKCRAELDKVKEAVLAAAKQHKYHCNVNVEYPIEMAEMVKNQLHLEASAMTRFNAICVSWENI
jgi:hypothetical protein